MAREQTTHPITIISTNPAIAGRLPKEPLKKYIKWMMARQKNEYP